MSDNRYSTFGGKGILFVIATADKPLTAEEIATVATEMGYDVANGTVTNALTKLHRAQYLCRRRRHEGKRGGVPYEYALAPREVGADA